MSALLRRRAVRLALPALAAVSLAAGVVIALADEPAPSPARSAAEHFLDRYVNSDGRVVRRDQGGDTVSEGQAYAMLLSVAIDDRSRFDTVWQWTRTHLQRADGTLDWHWQDGRVTGTGPAADADLDAARALLVAASRFHSRADARAARRIGDGVLHTETAHAAGKLVLVAGPWARSGAIVDPSYFSPRAFDALARATHDRRWGELRYSSIRLTWRLNQQGLPPDWAQVEPWGVHAVATPATGASPRYGYDAVRLPVRMAEACQPSARRRAAALWPVLRRADGNVPAQYALNGSPQTPGQSHPAALVGAAGAARAAGDRAASGRLLDDAASLDRRAPSYYGAAWVALGRVMLQTQWLGSCPG